MIDEQDQPPERVRLKILLGLAAKRVSRAEEKFQAARLELDAASIAHTVALNRLAAWDEVNPDPQFSLLGSLEQVGAAHAQ